MTNQELNDKLQRADGLGCYECLANNIATLTAEQTAMIADRMQAVDLNGQFMASAARYLQATDPERFGAAIKQLAEGVIDKDREHRYIGDLLTALYGQDFETRAAELAATDNNFRRMYKRLYPAAGM